MSSPSIAAVSLFTEDVAASRAFYTSAFEAPIVFEDEDCYVIKFNNLLLNILATTAATDLVDQVAQPRVGARCLFSIWVADVDAEFKRLKGKGVKFLKEPTQMPWGKKIAIFEDPVGHSWEVAQSD